MLKFYRYAAGAFTALTSIGLLGSGVVIGFNSSWEGVYDYDAEKTVQESAIEIETYYASNKGNLEDESLIENLPAILSDYSYPKHVSISVDGSFSDYCITTTTAKGNQAVTGFSYVSETAQIKPTSQTDSLSCNPHAAEYTVGEIADPNTETENETTGVALLSVGGVVLLFGSILTSGLRTEDDVPDAPKPAQVTASKEPKPSRKTNKNKWEDLIARYEAVKSEWATYELDTLKILSYPSIVNMGLEATSAFHKQLRITKQLAPAKALSSDATGSPFEKAVIDLEHAFDVMISEAKRMKWNNFTAKEQNSLRKAQSLFSIAMNSASSENERHIAYKQLIKELEGIVVLPDTTVLALEKSLPKAIESGVDNPTLTSEDVMRMISTPEKEKSRVIR